MFSTATANSPAQTEFKAPWHVIGMGVFSIVSLFCVGKAFSLKILADMRGETIDASGFMLLAVIVGCVVECLGAAYLYRHRSGTESMTAPMLVITLMIMMLLPIRFAVLSIWVNQVSL